MPYAQFKSTTVRLTTNFGVIIHYLKIKYTSVWYKTVRQYSKKYAASQQFGFTKSESSFMSKVVLLYFHPYTYLYHHRRGVAYFCSIIGFTTKGMKKNY
jgi:hypothetical protein